MNDTLVLASSLSVPDSFWPEAQLIGLISGPKTSFSGQDFPTIAAALNHYAASGALLRSIASDLDKIPKLVIQANTEATKLNSTGHWKHKEHLRGVTSGLESINIDPLIGLENLKNLLDLPLDQLVSRLKTNFELATGKIIDTLEANLNYLRKSGYGGWLDFANEPAGVVSYHIRRTLVREIVKGREINDEVSTARKTVGEMRHVTTTTKTTTKTARSLWIQNAELSFDILDAKYLTVSAPLSIPSLGMRLLADMPDRVKPMISFVLGTEINRTETLYEPRRYDYVDTTVKVKRQMTITEDPVAAQRRLSQTRSKPFYPDPVILLGRFVLFAWE